LFALIEIAASIPIASATGQYIRTLNFEPKIQVASMSNESQNRKNILILKIPKDKSTEPVISIATHITDANTQKKPNNHPVQPMFPLCFKYGLIAANPARKKATAANQSAG
jgi:hypothetical protein